MYGEVGRGLKSRSRWMDCDKERGEKRRHEEEDPLSENHKNTQILPAWDVAFSRVLEKLVVAGLLTEKQTFIQSDYSFLCDTATHSGLTLYARL